MSKEEYRQPDIDPIEGKYVNFFRLGHTEDVFVIDYYQIFPENDDDDRRKQLFGNPRYRLIISPTDAKQLLEQLSRAVKKYETDKKKFDQP